VVGFGRTLGFSYHLEVEANRGWGKMFEGPASGSVALGAEASVPV